jgi:hypothetical protein
MRLIKLSVTQAELDLMRESLLDKYKSLLENFAIAEVAFRQDSDPYVSAPVKTTAKKRGRPAGSRNKK